MVDARLWKVEVTEWLLATCTASDRNYTKSVVTKIIARDKFISVKIVSVHLQLSDEARAVDLPINVNQSCL